MPLVLHCCQRLSSPLLPLRCVPRSERFALTSLRLLVIHPSTLAGLPAPHLCLIHGGATRTRHDDAIPGKRLTMPLCRSARSAIASHRNMLNCHVFPQCTRQFSWSFLVLPNPCSGGHTTFSGLPGTRAAKSLPATRRTLHTVLMMLLLMKRLSQRLPWMPARHAAPDHHQCLVVFSPSSSNTASVFSSNPASVFSVPSCGRHVCCLTSIRIFGCSFSSFCTCGVLRSSLHQTSSV